MTESAAMRRTEIEVPVVDPATDPVHADQPPTDPLELAASWLPADHEDRALMTLATIDADGYPRARTVMLSVFDGERFHFHTDVASRKVHDLSVNPRVALTLLWPGFSHQLVVQGTATVADEEELAAAYAARSPYLRQLAWLNTAAFAQQTRERRERRWAAFAAANPEPAQPTGWIGYAVKPFRMLFWSSHPAAASRRLEYVRTADGWTCTPLPG
jgi:pyridoxamine 5'-phosphate oxidase